MSKHSPATLARESHQSSERRVERRAERPGLPRLRPRHRHGVAPAAHTAFDAGRSRDARATARTSAAAESVAHDLRHGIGTVTMLAAALGVVEDVGTEARALAAQLVTEMARIDELTGELFGSFSLDAPPLARGYGEVRLDELVRSVAESIRLTSDVDIDVLTTAVTVHHDRLGLWRAVRNLVCNALDAVGPSGRIRLRLFLRDGCAVLDVDDDGPGMAAGEPSGDSLGLTIVAALSVGWGGWFEVGTSSLGGCRVRLVVPRPAPTVGAAAARDAALRGDQVPPCAS